MTTTVLRGRVSYDGEALSRHLVAMVLRHVIGVRRLHGRSPERVVEDQLARFPPDLLELLWHQSTLSLALEAMGVRDRRSLASRVNALMARSDRVEARVARQWLMHAHKYRNHVRRLRRSVPDSTARAWMRRDRAYRAMSGDGCTVLRPGSMPSADDRTPE